jgi:hypothetical protein
LPFEQRCAPSVRRQTRSATTGYWQSHGRASRVAWEMHALVCQRCAIRCWRSCGIELDLRASFHGTPPPPHPVPSWLPSPPTSTRQYHPLRLIRDVGSLRCDSHTSASSLLHCCPTLRRLMHIRGGLPVVTTRAVLWGVRGCPAPVDLSSMSGKKKSSSVYLLALAFLAFLGFLS